MCPCDLWASDEGGHARPLRAARGRRDPRRRDTAPKADEVLVRVEAAAVNRADLDGLYPAGPPGCSWVRARRARKRRTRRGGTVEAVGPGVTASSPGDRVFGDMFASGVGAFAEYVCAPERAFEITPDGLSFEEAATLPHSAILAIQGLRLRDGRTIRGRGSRPDRRRVRQRRAVRGAGAKARGAEVTAVASPAKLDFVRALGADHAVDYTTTDYTTTGERYDWILDAYGAHSMRDVRRALRPHGVHVMLGGPTSRILESLVMGLPIKLASGKRTGLLIWWKPFNPDDVATLKELLAVGSVRPVIDRRYPLDEVVEALRWVDDGHAGARSSSPSASGPGSEGGGSRSLRRAGRRGSPRRRPAHPRRPTGWSSASWRRRSTGPTSTSCTACPRSRERGPDFARRGSRPSASTSRASSTPSGGGDQVQAGRPRVRRPVSVRSWLVRRVRGGPGAGVRPDPGRPVLRGGRHLPHSGILALQGLRRRNGRTVGSGDRVLIDGASGNVGPFAVQIAKSLGAEVTAVCSADKADFVRSLGADHVINYRTTNPTRTGQRYDWILAVASHHSLPAYRRALRPGGVFVTLGGTARTLVDRSSSGLCSRWPAAGRWA